jgi:hypothetical protein
MVRPAETRCDAAAHSRKDVKLDRSLVWKPVRDERSVSVYAYVARNAQVSVSESPATLNDNTCESKLERTSPERSPKVSAFQPVDEYAREEPVGVLDLQPGERRGYWKRYAPDKWYRQAKIHGKLNNHLLLDTGGEVFILDTAFARKVGC